MNATETVTRMHEDELREFLVEICRTRFFCSPGIGLERCHLNEDGAPVWCSNDEVALARRAVQRLARMTGKDEGTIVYEAINASLEV